MPPRPGKISNPIVANNSEEAACSKYKVSAKGFFSTYTQKLEEGVLDGAKSLVTEVKL